ncbi:hypothetical protein CL622_02450 [archaeon]|nr:hypothetical protein [archaeon]
MDYPEKIKLAGDVFEDKDESDKISLWYDVFEDYPDDEDDEDNNETEIAYGEDWARRIKWEHLTDEQQDDLLDHFTENDDMDHAWEIKQPKSVLGWDYKAGKAKKQSIHTLTEWGFNLYGIGLQLHEGKALGLTKIPNYPKAEQRTPEEQAKVIEQLNKDEDLHYTKAVGSKATVPLGDEIREVAKYIQDHDPSLTDKETGKYNGADPPLIVDDDEISMFKMKYKDMFAGQDRTIDRYTDVPGMAGEPSEVGMGGQKEIWKGRYVYMALTGNVTMADHPSITERSDQALGLAHLIQDNPELTKMYEPILKEADRLNDANYDLFLKAPEFYRGTDSKELDSYLETGLIGGDPNVPYYEDTLNKYNYVSLSMDRKNARGDTNGRKWEPDGKGGITGGKVVIVFEGDEVRKNAVPVQYNPAPLSFDWSFGDPSETAGTPLSMQFYQEREARMNEGIKHPKIKEINFGDAEDLPKTMLVQQMLIEKYKSLVDGDESRLTFHKFAMDEDDKAFTGKEPTFADYAPKTSEVDDHYALGGQVPYSKIVGSTIVDRKFPEPDTRMAKQRMQDNSLGHKKYLNRINWSD